MKKMFLKIIRILLVILFIEMTISAIFITKNSRQEEVIRIATKPIEKKLARSQAPTDQVTRITSSSRAILNKIVNTMKNTGYGEGYWKQCKNAVMTPTPTSNGLYYIDIPTFYFKQNVGGGSSTLYLYSQKIKEFDFSGIDIGGVTTLPDFSKWPNLKRLNFSNCNISNISGFTKTSYLKRITYVNLTKNKISDPPTGVVKDSRFDLKNQEISINLGKIQKNSKLMGTLPGIFTKSYADLQAPKKLTKSANAKISGKNVTVDTSRAGKSQKATITISDSNSKFNGSKVYFLYEVSEKSTNNSNSNKNSNSNNGSNSNNYNNYYQTTIMQTLKATVDSQSGYAKSKNITVQLSGENVSVNKATIYVNNTKVTNNSGKGVYKATKNGTYKILVTYPGLDNIKLDYKVNGIDTTKPSYTYTTKMNEGSNVKNLTIVGKDNCALKSISVNGNRIYSYDGKTLYSAMPVNYKISKTGNYKIKVEDMAGNTYEKTENIRIDTTYPQFQKVTVVKDNKVGYVGNTGDSKYCKAKIGDTITVTMEAHEQIAGFENIYINGKIFNAGSQTINKNTLKFVIELTEERVQEYKMGGYITIEVRNVRDKWGNKGNYSNDKLLYLDKTAPTIKQVTITGGTASKDEQVIEIYKDQTIKISIVFSERLSNQPGIYIGGNNGIVGASGVYRTATFEKDVKLNGKSCSQYSLTIKTNWLIENLKAYNFENTYIPIKITGYQDNAGLTGESMKIDKDNKASNGVCLVYGKVQTGDLYFVGTEKVNEPSIGDINADGYINKYDELLLKRHLLREEELSDEQKKYANIDGKNKIELKDLIELKKLIKQTENELFKDSGATFKIYDVYNQQLKGQNLTFSVEEGSDLVTITNTEDTVTITAKGEEGKVKVKASYLSENGYEERVGTMDFIIGKLHSRNIGGFEVKSENKTNRKIMGDVNKDGFVTKADAKIVQKAIADIIKLTDEQEKLANVVDDGVISILDGTAIEKLSYYNYNGMKRGDRITLKFNSYNGETYNDFKNDAIQNQIVWTTKENTDMVTINQNSDNGSAEIIINDKAVAGTRLTVICKARISSEEEETAEFNIEIVDNTEVELTNKEIEYDLSNLEKLEILRCTTNLSNREISWKSSDENVARLEVDEFGNAEVIPIKTGKVEVSATVDGVSAICTVNITESIKTITSDKQVINLKETQEEEIDITTEPLTATEIPVVISSDEDIAKVYQDEETGAYKIVGVSEGNATVEISSPSNSEIKQTIEVNVKSIVAPTIKSVEITQEETEKIYGEGETINIKFTFTDVIKGDAPNLKLGFGKYESIETPQFVKFGDDNISIIYQYKVQEGDNGILVIKSLEGGSLTDDTGKMEAILTVEPEYYEEEVTEEIQEDQQLTEETIETNISNEEENILTSKIDEVKTNYQKNGVIVRAMASEIEDSEVEEDEIVSSGIYRDVGAVIADTTRPTIQITASVDKNTCWLTKGDVAKVSIVASEELKEPPTVTMGGIKANVEGSGTEFVASLSVTEELQEGYLEIKVSQYQDLAGNFGDEVIAKEENIDEPIIVDYSGTKIESIELIKEEGKEYKAGDKFKIRVTFSDETIERLEYISATSTPKVNIKFGENEAQGLLESDYTTGEYVQSIIYTYTISDKDSGKISINGLSGNISDIAGNATELDHIEQLPEITVTNVKNDSNDDDSQDLSKESEDSNKDEGKGKTDEKDAGKYSGILPKTGATALGIIFSCVGIGAITSGISYMIKRKKYREY